MHFFKTLYLKAIEIRTGTFIALALLFVFTCGLVIHLIEPRNFPDLMTGCWWTMTTVTTIGYGDVAPETVAGRLFGIFVLDLFGIGFFGIIIGKIVNFFTAYYKKKREGVAMYQGRNHIVIIGWTQTSKLAVREILESESSSQEIVLISHLDETPVPYEKRIHYVKGSPTDFAILNQANAQEASSVLIFSPDHIENSDLADGYTLLVATTVERYDEEYKQNIYTVVEIQKSKHQDNFRHVKVDEFILSKQAVSSLMISASKKGTKRG